MALSKRWIAFLRTLALALGLAVALILAAAAYVYWLSQGLPDLDQPGAVRAARTTVVYAADGSVLAEWHGEQDRRPVKLLEMSGDVRDAVVAVEDPRFWQHDGVDMDALTGAARGDTISGAKGGSGITLQLVKLLFSGGKRGLAEKVREVLMAYELSASTSKERVLEAYLNMIYFGEGAYGVEAASRRYFGKRAVDLDLAESATLAGIIDAPSRYAPTVDPDKARTRRDEVLDKMRDLGFITSEQEIAARTATLTLAPPPAVAATKAPYFVEYVKQELIDRLGSEAVFAGGLEVRTTLQPAMQQEAESAIASVLPLPGDPEAALVCIQPGTGRIVALVGGRDFNTAKYNLATQGRRQPGSAFKPFVLVAALEKGVNPDERFQTSPYTVNVKDGVWRVENYENAFTSGVLTLRAATDWSVNAVFARLIMRIGPEAVVDAARRMGITSPLEPNPAIALGGLSKGVSPLEMASAYGTLATGGMHVDPVAIVKVTGEGGKVLYEPKAVPERAVSQAVAAQASGMLADVVQRGTGTNARIGVWSAGKTGTTQSYRDAWFVGYTGDLVTSVWVGYRQAQVDMLNVHGIKVTGGSFPAMIWARYMGSPRTRIAPEQTPGSAETTATLDLDYVTVRICRSTFLLANPRCPDVVEVDLRSALAPKKVCNKH